MDFNKQHICVSIIREQIECRARQMCPFGDFRDVFLFTIAKGKRFSDLKRQASHPYVFKSVQQSRNPFKEQESALKERTEAKTLQCTTLNKCYRAAPVNIQYMALIIIKYNNKVSSETQKKYSILC